MLDLDWTQVVPHEHIKGGLVHTGFNQAYDSIKPQVRKAILQMLDGPCKGCTITTTGHSLGAAVVRIDMKNSNFILFLIVINIFIIIFIIIIYNF